MDMLMLGAAGKGRALETHIATLDEAKFEQSFQRTLRHI